MNADDLPTLREELEAHGLWANKGLGQHFLLDLNITRRIARAAGDLQTYLPKVAPADFFPGADRFGPSQGDPPIVPVYRGDQLQGFVFLNSDLANSVGYSGKPIHLLAGIDPKGVITGVRLVDHKEPIVLVGIPEARIKEVTEKYAGLDLKKEASAETEQHELDIVSGATVTVMIIDDSIIRAGLAVAKALSLGGLAPDTDAAATHRSVDRSIAAIEDWQTLTGDGSVRHFTLDVATINADFAALGDPVRLRLFNLVAGAGEVCACDLQEPLGKSQPTVSHHTKALADAGLIVGDKRGRWVWWSVVPGRVEQLHQALRPA